jgi:tight adherence protein C
MGSILYLLFAITAFCAVIAIYSASVSLRERLELSRRTMEILHPYLAAETTRAKPEAIASRLSTLANSLRKRIGVEHSPALRARLAAAGIESELATDLYFGLRLILPVIGGVGMVFFSRNITFILGTAAAGYMLPDFALERMIKRYRHRIRRALPDTVDLFVVCMDAGLGVEQAIQRTAEELSLSYPELCRELAITNQEQQMGRPRQEAWKNMVSRTKSPDIEQMVGMLLQSERFGTPISEALRSFADALRIQRKLAAEERAGRSAVVIIFPLVLFIFPVIFVVLIGPAILSLIHGLGGLGF